MKRKDFLAVTGFTCMSVLCHGLNSKAAVTDNLKAGALAGYPIGAIFISTVNENPAFSLGGTWVAWGGSRTSWCEG